MLPALLPPGPLVTAEWDTEACAAGAAAAAPGASGAATSAAAATNLRVRMAENAILNMSAFLLRWIRRKVPAACCEHLAGTALG